MNLFFYGVGILFCIGSMYGYAAGDVQLRHALSELEKDDLTYQMRVLSVDPCDDSLSPIWIVQQSIEEAHVRNDFESIDALYKYFKRETILESRWEAVSHEILETTHSPSSHWQNWYSRWIKWESQSSWKEAVLSALFFPQRYFLESDVYGQWGDNGATCYSLALSSHYNNPQAKIYHVHNIQDDDKIIKSEGQRIRLDAFIKRLMMEEIVASKNEMGRELYAIAQLSGQYEEIIHSSEDPLEILETLKDRSITALLEYTHLLNDMDKQLEHYYEIGERGLKSAYFYLTKRMQDTNKKLVIYDKVPGRGYVTKWKTTKNTRDFNVCMDYFLELGRKGNAYGYFKAADLTLDRGIENITDPVKLTQWLLISLTEGIHLAENHLIKFTRGIYRNLLSSAQQKELVAKIKVAQQKGQKKKNKIHQKIEEITHF